MNYTCMRRSLLLSLVLLLVPRIVSPSDNESSGDRELTEASGSGSGEEMPSQSPNPSPTPPVDCELVGDGRYPAITVGEDDTVREAICHTACLEQVRIYRL